MSYLFDLVKENEKELRSLHDDGYRTSSIPGYGKGSLKACEAQALYSLIKNKKYNNILDIGTGPGFTCLYFAKALKDLNSKGKVTTIDISSAFQDKVKLLLNNFGLQNYVEFLCGDSKDVLDTISDRVYDFASIDGFHSYDQCKIEFNKVNKMIREGGAIAFDDIYLRPKNNPGPRNVFDEIDKSLGDTYYLEEKIFDMFKYPEDVSEVSRLEQKWELRDGSFVLKESNPKETVGLFFKK